jgi:lambda family phage minor tail protein L
LPRPTLTFSNAFGTLSSILLTVNAITRGNDLTGATVKRIRTKARFLDAANFPSNVNPYGTPDPTAEGKQEIYVIDRKSAENRTIVSFELAAVFDMAGVRAPKRQCTRKEFPSIGLIAG